MDCQRDITRASNNLPLVLREPRVLKDELRMTIMAKRHARGEGKLNVEFREPERRELSEAEMERKERRREQNRRAAQRCRRKKRMNQMSVLQNYDWILSRNQQLIQEVETLRQDRDQLQTMLNSHLQTCTCARADNAPLLTPMGKIKTEPREGSPTIQQGYPSPTTVSYSSPNTASYPSSNAASYPSPISTSCSLVSPMACAFDSSAGDSSVVSDHRGFSQAAGLQALPYPTQHTQGPSSCVSFASFPQEQTRTDLAGEQNFVIGVDTRCSTISGNVNTASSAHSPMARSPHSTHSPQPMGSALSPHVPVSTLSAAANGSIMSPMTHQFLPPPSPYAHYMADELAMLTRTRSCIFQDDLATPHSNEGRNSTSSVCSDVSTASELRSDVSASHDDVTMSDFVGAGASATDVSELLAQISSSELMHLPDDVFGDPALLQDNHFL